MRYEYEPGREIIVSNMGTIRVYVSTACLYFLCTVQYILPDIHIYFHHDPVGGHKSSVPCPIFRVLRGTAGGEVPHMQLFGAAAGLLLAPQACGPRRYRRDAALVRIPAHAPRRPALGAAKLLAKSHAESRGDGHGGRAHDGHVELDHVQQLEGRGGVGKVRVQVRLLVENDHASDSGYDGAVE